MARRRETLIDKWEWWRMIVILLSLVFSVVLFRFVMIPTGLLALGMFRVVGAVVRPLYVDDVTRGSFLPGTLPYKVTKYFEVYRGVKERLFTPMSALGMGPPVEDPDHDLQPGWTPPTRMAAYWSMAFALVMSTLDTLAHGFVSPFWGFSLPAPALAVISAIGWYALAQIAVGVLRFQDRGERLHAPEPAPATMLSEVRANFDVPRILRRSLLIALAPVAVIFILMMSFRLPAIPCLIAMAVIMLVVFLAVGSNEMKVQYRAQWEERNDKRAQWEGNLAYMKMHAPLYISEAQIPSIEEWEQSPQAQEEGAFYDPSVNVATFRYAPNSNYNDILKADIPGRVAGALNAPHVATSPVGEVNQETGQEMGGTVGTQGFRVWWSEQDVDIKRVLDPTESDWIREFGLRAVVLPTISSIRGMGDIANLKSFSMMTRVSSSAQAIELTIQPPPNITLDNFLNATSRIQDLLHVQWFRPYQDRSGESSNEITLMLGDSLNSKGVRFTNPARMMRRKIRDADWRYYFYKVGISNTDMTNERSATSIVDELVFTLPPGTDYKTIVNSISTLKTTSRNQFMEVTLGDSIEKANSNKEKSSGKIISQDERDRRERSSSTKFTLVVSEDDPLARMFPFGDYATRILFDRVPGHERLNWHPGVLSNDELAVDSYDAEEPHLLIAGSSGSGKPQDVDSWTLTTEGPKRHGDIQVGDVIYDINWDEHPVTQTFDALSPRRGFRVGAGDSERVVFSGDHLFSVDSERLQDEWVSHADPDLIHHLWALSHHMDSLSRDTGLGTTAAMDDQGGFFPLSEWASEGDLNSFLEPNNTDVIASIHPVMWGMMLASSSSEVGILTDVDVEGVTRILDEMGYLYQVSPDKVEIPSIRRLASIMHRDHIDDLVPAISRVFRDQVGSILFGVVAAGSAHQDSDSALDLHISAVARLRHLGDLADDFRIDATDVRGEVVSAVISSDAEGDIKVQPYAGFRLHQRCFLSGLVDQDGTPRIHDGAAARDLLRMGHYVDGDAESMEPVPAEEILTPGLISSMEWPLAESYARGLTRAIGRLAPDMSGYIDISDEGDQDTLRRVIHSSRSVYASATLPEQVDILSMTKEEFVRRREREHSDPVLFTVPSDWSNPDTGAADYAEHVNQRVKFTMGGDVALSANDLVNIMQGSLSHSLINRVINDLGLRPAARWEPPFVDPDGSIVSEGEEPLYRGSLLARAVANFLLLRSEDRSGDLAMRIWTADDLHDLDGDFTILGETIHTEPVPRDELPLMRCIKVASPTMTYRAGERGDLVTHNSVVVQNMLTQLIHNNSPADLRLWLCEPKIGLQRFDEFDVVDRMVDSWSPTEDFFHNVGELFEDAVQEMLRRNKLLRQYTGKNTLPEKLQQGRQIARDEGPSPDGTPHPLDIPFIIIVVEECATVFADAPDKESRVTQSEILYNAARIAREARSAGIFMVCLTQYPTNASIPSVIRNQMRRIGLACRNALASRVVIEENGLEELRIKGTGLIKDGRNYRQFRGFYLQTGNPEKGEKNDLIDSLGSLPRKDGHVEEKDSAMGLDGRVYVPDPDDNIFKMFRYKMGAGLDRAIDNKRRTADKDESWYEASSRS